MFQLKVLKYLIALISAIEIVESSPWSSKELFLPFDSTSSTLPTTTSSLPFPSSSSFDPHLHSSVADDVTVEPTSFQLPTTNTTPSNLSRTSCPNDEMFCWLDLKFHELHSSHTQHITSYSEQFEGMPDECRKDRCAEDRALNTDGYFDWLRTRIGFSCFLKNLEKEVHTGQYKIIMNLIFDPVFSSFWVRNLLQFTELPVQMNKIWRYMGKKGHEQLDEQHS
ncbi:hypothetical protein HELRODRAFT_178027 [Helobdella robusta]|uniref:Uncharacterized protein n=1 Tax=Helobdella robusta TaxID=6412 RepID=T1FCM6_HELRO|nr:hypothetical protein HELRODRAFT_178027 [Helobdella robusta]ESN97590.1 hypothetical protein HELRODRAFT_178027 [Helobdella robusta]